MKSPIWRPFGFVLVNLMMPYRFLIGLVFSVILTLSGILSVADSVKSILSEVEYSRRSPTELANSHPQVSVVLITPRDFRDFYRERSPLSRCVLAEQLERILLLSSAQLIIDLDLSPLVGETKAERYCQSTLESLLSSHSRRVWAINPTDSESQPWKAAIENSEAFKFFDPGLVIRFGLLGLQPLKSLGVLSTLSPEEHATSAFAADFKDAGQPEVLFRISYEGMKVGRVGVYHVSDLPYLSAMSSRYIIFGGNWDSQDKYFTALGMDTPGALVHASILDSYLNGDSDWFGRFFVINIGGFFLSVALTYAYSLRKRYLKTDKVAWAELRLLQSRVFYVNCLFWMVVILLFSSVIIYLVIVNPLHTFLPELILAGVAHVAAGVAVPRVDNEKTGMREDYRVSNLINVVRINAAQLIRGTTVSRILFMGWVLKWIIPLLFIGYFWEVL